MNWPEIISKGATFSPDRIHRYRLWRIWNASLPVVAFCALNPSTADEEMNDPTIRREIGFAISWGFGGLEKVNIFGARSTDPKRLLDFADPVGPGTDEAIREVTARAGVVVAAWGALPARPPWMRERGRNVLELLTENADVHALRVTKAGFPSHPLYLPGDLKPVLFRARRRAA